MSFTSHISVFHNSTTGRQHSGLSKWRQTSSFGLTTPCSVSPFSLQTWFPGVTVLSEAGLTEHPAGTTPMCVLDVPGCRSSTETLCNNTFECTHHHSLQHLKKSWFKDTEIFPFSQTKMSCLSNQRYQRFWFSSQVYTTAEGMGRFSGVYTSR